MKHQRWYLVIVLAFYAWNLAIGQPEGKFRNPILPGSHPDPSVCRVGQDYYLVTSTFNWYPGIPIYKSQDLVNWKLIGHVLEDKDSYHIPDGRGQHAGIWAPTIRYHEGVFYVTVTNFGSGNSIITTATDPAGSWSKPKRLHDSAGIDGSLLFDEGNVWYCFSQDHKIWFQEFDLDKMELLGAPKLIMDEIRFEGYTNIEGPHIYKLESGEYMLLIAAGGTGSNKHNVSVFKSENPDGPYQPCPNNPVLTHDGYESPISVTGHADIVQTQNGEWWAVMLGMRNIDGYDITGRETFMTPFVWEDGWPVFNPEGNGKIRVYDDKPDLPEGKRIDFNWKDEFNDDELNPRWNFFRVPPGEPWHKLNGGKLTIRLQPERTTDQTHNPVIARRITENKFGATTKLTFDPKKGEEAGLIAMMHHKAQFRCGLVRHDGEKRVRITEYVVDRKTKEVSQRIVAEQKYDKDEIVIGLEVDRLDYQFLIGDVQSELKPFGEVLSGKIISRQLSGTYTGAYVGMYGTSNGNASTNDAYFDWFYYTPDLKYE